MSYLNYYLVTTSHDRLEGFEAEMRRREGSRARSARIRRRLLEQGRR